MIALLVFAGSKRNTTSNLTVEKKNKRKNGLVANSHIAHSREPKDSAPLKQVSVKNNL